MSYGPVWYEHVTRGWSEEDLSYWKNLEEQDQLFLGSANAFTIYSSNHPDNMKCIDIFWCQPGVYVGKKEDNKILVATAYWYKFVTNDEYSYRTHIRTYRSVLVDAEALQTALQQVIHSESNTGHGK